MEAKITVPIRLVGVTCLVLYVIGCGAVTGLDIGEFQTGGRSGVGGGLPDVSIGGAPSSGGSTTLGTGGTACCKAIPTCDPDDTSYPVCPVGATCYSREACCTIIACAKASPACHAIPTCDEGDKEISGACPPAWSCYTRTACDATVTCLSGNSGTVVDAGACDPSAEYNRFYVATSSEQCVGLDYICTATIPTFSNACGCGCEQGPSCPERADCSTSDPFLCTYAGRLKCPFTRR